MSIGSRIARQAEQRRSESAVQRRLELEAEVAALRKRNLHLETTVAASLGSKVAEVAKLERELAIALAAIPETVTCSGCGLVVLVSSLHWGTRATHYGRHGEPCGSWMKDGKRWVLPCEHPADVIDQTEEAGDE